MPDDSRRGANLAWGVPLILLGILFLLRNLNLVDLPLGRLAGVLIFAVPGLAFLVLFLTDRRHWWAAIPAFTCLGLATAVSAELWFSGRDMGGAAFLGGTGLGFWAVYLARREHWWAMIPGGALVTLAAVAGLSARAGGLDPGAVLFLGLAVTFGLVYLLAGPGRAPWALYPAAAMLLLAVLIGIGFDTILRHVMPVLLIVVGAGLLLRSRHSQGG